MTVRELLSDPARWTKGAWARDEHGQEANSTSPNAACWCLVGAISRCYRPESCDEGAADPNAEARAKVKAVLNHHATIVDFNDDPKTTHADLLAVLDAAGI